MQTVETLDRQNEILLGINRIFEEALVCQTAEELRQVCLQVAVETTASWFGFLGLVNPRTGILENMILPNPHFQIIQMENSEESDQRLSIDRFYRLWFDKIKQERSIFYTNDLFSKNELTNTPCGYPPLQAILGVPLIHRSRIVGMLGLANREAGYGIQQEKAAESLAPAIVLSLANKQNEIASQEANETLEQRVQDRTAELETANQKLVDLNQEIETTNEELRIEIEEREQAEEELRVAYEDLEDALKQEKELRKRLIQTEKFAALARLVASVAHEINNPLQTIQNSLFLLEPEVSSPDSQQILEMAISECQRVTKLVLQLRETYRPSKDLQPVVFNPLEVMQKVVSLLEPQFRQSDVKCKLHLPDRPLQVRGIPDQIQQVILNICLNAIDAMQPKGGQLNIFFSRNPLTNKVRISFWDNGPGIPEENLKRIFEPFYTTKERGSGLGLAISYEIIKNHGGEISVESRPGKGTTFKVWLPLI